MGCFGGTKSVTPSPAVDNAAEVARKERQRILSRLNSEAEKAIQRSQQEVSQRALFLGTGESGKSTVFKQMRINYGQSFDGFERFQYAKLIWIETLRAIRHLLDIADEMQIDLPDHHVWNMKENARYIKSLDLSDGVIIIHEQDPGAREFLQSHVADHPQSHSRNDSAEVEVDKDERMRPQAQLRPGEAMDRTRIATAISQLWTGWPVLRQLLERNADTFSSGMNTAHFFSRVMDFASPNFMADNNDILRARIKTTGITEASFDIRGNELTVIDVGGQRVERKKWIHCFDDITCVLFVVAVSEFDQMLREEKSVRRIDESLRVFEQTVNSKYFIDKPVTLFFNKIDLLETKLSSVSFSKYFPDYTGQDESSLQVLDYLEKLFKKKMRLNGRNLYVHRTCATDTSTMKFVIEAVTDMIFYENMKWAGMV